MQPNESGGEEFQESEMVANRSGIEQGHPTHLSLLSCPSSLGELQERSWHFHVKESLVPMKPFAPSHRCTLHPATPMSKKQGAVHSNIYELPFVGRFGNTQAGLLTNTSFVLILNSFNLGWDSLEFYFRRSKSSTRS